MYDIFIAGNPENALYASPRALTEKVLYDYPRTFSPYIARAPGVARRGGRDKKFGHVIRRLSRRIIRARTVPPSVRAVLNLCLGGWGTGARCVLMRNRNPNWCTWKREKAKKKEEKEETNVATRSGQANESQERSARGEAKEPSERERGRTNIKLDRCGARTSR